MDELKSCPFYGGEAVIWQGPQYYKVACKKQFRCSAHVGPFDTEDEALAAWNRREHTPSPERIGELLEADRDNRAAVLPVAIGTPVFRIYNTKGCKNCTKKDVACSGDKCPEPKYREENFSFVHMNIIRDIRFTREDAEAALEETMISVRHRSARDASHEAAEKRHATKEDEIR